MSISTFHRNHGDQIKKLSDYYMRHLLEDIMPFWDEKVLDREQGGYYNCFDRGGRLTSDVKSGWFVGRNLYMYSALYNKIEKRDSWLGIAKEGRLFLEEKALDKNTNRFHFMMNRDGSKIVGKETVFTDHFAVKGLFEYIEAAGADEDIAFAEKLFDTLIRNVSDPRIALAESVPGFKKHAVTFITLLVGIEAKRLFKNKAEKLIADCLNESLYTFADDVEKAPLEYVSVSGKPLYEGAGRVIDPGHTMESLWFAMHEGIESGDRKIIDRAAEILDWVIDRAWDSEYGGFYQNVDVFDTVPEKAFLKNNYAGIDVAWNDKIWWVQSEALYTLALSSLLTGNERHFEYFLKLHEHCKQFFADREYGEWYALLKRDGSILCDDKGTALKGPYHVPRSVMQLALLFKKYSPEQ